MSTRRKAHKISWDNLNPTPKYKYLLHSQHQDQELKQCKTERLRSSSVSSKRARNIYIQIQGQFARLDWQADWYELCFYLVSTG